MIALTITVHCENGNYIVIIIELRLIFCYFIFSYSIFYRFLVLISVANFCIDANTTPAFQYSGWVVVVLVQAWALQAENRGH